MPPERSRRGRQATTRQRDAARETARRLMAEGRWGGSVGRAVDNGGRRRPRRRGTLSPRQLLAILERVAREGDHLSARRIFRLVPATALRLDHAELTSLVSDVLAHALAEGAVPRQSLIEGDDVTPVWRGRRPHRPAATTVTVPDPRPDDFAHYRDDELVDALLLTLSACSRTTPTIVRANEWLSGLVREIATAAHGVLANRGAE